MNRIVPSDFREVRGSACIATLSNLLFGILLATQDLGVRIGATPSRRVALSCAGGLALALAYSQPQWSWLSWIGLIPLLLAIRRQPLLSVFGFAWLLGFCFFGGTLYWIAITYHRYADKSYLASVSAVALLSSFEAVFVALSVTAALLLARRVRLILIAALPIAWVAGEWLRSVSPIGFTWGLLGYALSRDLGVIQIAEITGAYGVSWVIVFVNIALFSLVFCSNDLRRKSAMGVSLVICILMVLGFGVFQLNHLDAASPVGTLKVGIAQGALPQTFHFRPESVPAGFEVYEAATKTLSKSHPDVIVWPENAIGFLFQPGGFYPNAFELERKYQDKILALASAAHTPILFGAPSLYFGSSLSMRDRAYLISDRGAIVDYSDKVELVPFSEYLPASSVLGRFISPLIQRPIPFTAGDFKNVLYLGNARIGSIICYELLFPYISREMVHVGSNVLVNISNDTWFGKTSAPYELLSIDVFRAVENRVPLIRVANSGFSATIDSTGRIHGRTELFARTNEIESVEWRNTGTFYTAHGDVFAKLCFGITVVGSLLGIFLAIWFHSPQRDI